MQKIIGQPIPRKDAFEKITGKAIFTFDIDNIPHLLYAKFLTSPYAHARIININTSDAENLPGVKAIVTGRDWPVKIGLYAGDRDILAFEKVRWMGQPVVAIAAKTEKIAEDALQKIKIDYEQLPAIFDPVKAKESKDILVHEKMGEYEHSLAFNPIPGTNIANHFKLRKGNVEEAFSGAEFIVKNTYTMPQVSHSYMEPIVSLGHYKKDGSIEVWSSASFSVHRRRIWWKSRIKFRTSGCSTL